MSEARKLKRTKFRSTAKINFSPFADAQQRRLLFISAHPREIKFLLSRRELFVHSLRGKNVSLVRPCLQFSTTLNATFRHTAWISLSVCLSEKKASLAANVRLNGSKSELSKQNNIFLFSLVVPSKTSSIARPNKPFRLL